MRIATWNINGLRSSFEQVKKFLIDYDIDVLALQEIKVHSDDLSEEIKNIDGYSGFFNPAQKRGYSGTAFYTKVKPENVENGLANVEIDYEGRVISLDVGPYKIINFYFPHSSRDLHRLDFKLAFNKEAKSFIKKNLSDNLIVCGDLNVAHNEIDLARPKDNKKNAGFTQVERTSFDDLLSVGLVDVFREHFPDKQEFSWWGHFHNSRERNIGWRIDYFLTKRKLSDKVKKVEILTKVYGSDHCPVVIEL